MTSQPKKRMLILSFSDISVDARILKQINRFKGNFTIVTCGYGPPPKGVARHLQIPPDQVSLALDGRLITVKQYALAYWTLPGVTAMKHLTKPLKGSPDVIIANEPETVPIALRLKARCGVHADLHEYTPSLHEHIPAWNKRIKPYNEWLVRRYTTKADTWSSPSEGVNLKYERKFGFKPVTVTNAAPFHALKPSKIEGPIRIVHHGGAQRNRNLDVMIDGFTASSINATFDMFLTGIDPEYREELREYTKDNPRITVHDGIPYPELVSTLNTFDLGLFSLPPVTYNYEWALPNKLFDFVQARLGQVISPNPEMKRTVVSWKIGTVADGYTAEDLTRTLDSITAADVQQWKHNAHKQARDLSADSQVEIWAGSIDELIRDCKYR